jgi:hypothetical protein
MEIKKATEVNGCNTCKKGLSKTQKLLVGLSFYILISSIYGTIKILQFLSNII